MPTLLIVDDDPAIREVFSILLAEHGYTVHTADGGTDCLACLARVIPDLVMLDIMMFPVDGWETLTAIRGNPRTRGVPAIMFSGKNPSAEEIWQYGGWIEDYLMKPITMPTITSALTNIFERYRRGLTERECFLQAGADPALVDEYLSLKRLLFVQDKFTREVERGLKAAGYKIPPQKARFDELSRILAACSPQTTAPAGRGSV